MLNTPKFIPTKPDYVQFDGGLDTVTPLIQIPKGYIRSGINYEVAVNSGYRWIDGYERFDGQAKPSAATYSILPVTITGSYSVGDTITGVTSTETAVIAAATATQFIITKVSGNFEAAGEVINIGGLPVATSTGIQTAGSAETPKLNAIYTNAAADIYRADITAVPGSGPIRGVWLLDNVTYAVRDDALATEAVIHKSTSSGWSAIDIGYRVAFNTGTAEFGESETLTQGANTATILRVVLQSGSWAGGTAAGFIILAAAGSPGAFAAGVATSASGSASLTGAEIQQSIPAGGRYETIVYDFGLGQRIYGCSGRNTAGFEFDGTVYVPIFTGLPANEDLPAFVYQHKNHLFFAFDKSAQHSGIGKPYEWTLLSGAAELSMGDTITGFSGQPGSEATGGALLIYTKNNTKVLYGSSASGSDIWNLVNFTNEDQRQGARAYSPQSIGGMSYVVDSLGILSIQASQAYGNFQSAVISQRVQNVLNPKLGLFAASSIQRAKNQLRYFFSDGSGFYMTFNGRKLRGFAPIQFPDNVECIWSGEMNDGSEITLFGSDNGMVYQMDKGTSFDGEPIEANMAIAFNPSDRVRLNKHYHRSVLEFIGEGYSEVSFTFVLNYGDPETAGPGHETMVIPGAVAYWDLFTWDEFSWDIFGLGSQRLDMGGSGENVSLILSRNSDYFKPATFSSAIMHYKQLRYLR